MRYPTIKEIARVAGVSANTVSRALRNKDDISEETKRKIVKIADKMGYEKNIMASNLRSNSNRIIGVIIIDNANPFYSEVLSGIEAQAKEEGYNILIYNTCGQVEEEEKAIKIMIAHRVEGIIIDPLAETGTENLMKIRERRIPFVQASHYLDIDANWVGYDDVKAFYSITDFVLNSGKRNITFFGGYPGDSTYDDRIDGFKKALIDNDIKFNKNQIINCEVEFKKIFRKAIEMGNEMTADAICAYNDISALAIIKALRELDYRVPEDIAVTGIDNLLISELVNPGLTTVNLPKKRAGNMAVKILIDEIQGQLSDKRRIKLPVDLIIRDSV